MWRIKRLRTVVLLLLMLPLSSAYSAETAATSRELPEPLTLDAALSLIDFEHPALRSVDADVQLAKSNLQQNLSVNDLNVNLNSPVAVECT